MNIYIYKTTLLVLWLFGMVLATSCTDYLDKAPLAEINPDDA